MAFNPPTDETIRFPNSKDSLPTVYNAGSTSIAARYTKVWAEYHNKIRNFIGIVEPLCSPTTAVDETNTLSMISYWTLSPAPTINDIIYSNAKKAYNLGKSPPTMVLPFEIVLTCSSDNYSNQPSLGTRPSPLLYYASRATLNKIVGNVDFATAKPFVSCNLRKGSDIVLNSFSTRWIINSYCVPGQDTLLIRGTITDVAGTSVYTSSLPALSYHFPDGNNQNLHVAIVGTR